MPLSNDRNTPRREGEMLSDPVAAAGVIYAGSLVVLGATGYAEAASTATGLKARGIAQQYVNNEGADGAEKIVTRRGVHRLGNDGSINRTHITGTAYIVDDETVAATDGTSTRSAAGTIIDVDDDGVWVDL